MTDKKFVVTADYQPAGDQPSAIDQLADGVCRGLTSQVLLGVTGSGKTYTMAKMIEKVQRPAIIMAPNKTLAAQLFGEFRHYFPYNAVEYFVSYYDYYQPEAYIPSSDVYIEKDASINAHIEQMRLSATKSLVERQDVVIVATVSAIYGLGDPTTYTDMALYLRQGDSWPRRDLLRRLTEMQYRRNNLVLQRGDYRVRGEVIDIYPAELSSDAIRIKFFDDEIEDITLLDPLTGKEKQSLPYFTVFSKTHYVTPQETLLRVIEEIKLDLVTQLTLLRANDKLVEAQRLEQRTIFDIEMMREIGYCTGIENYSRYLSGSRPGDPPPTLFDYLPSDTITIIDESHVAVPQIRAMYRGDYARKSTLVEHGFRLPAALDNRPLRFEEWEARVRQAIYISATPGDYEKEHAEHIVELLVRPTGLVDPEIDVRPVTTQVDDLLSEVRLRTQKGERVLVTTLTKRMAEDLMEYLNDYGERARYLHSDIDTVERVEIIRQLRMGTFDVLVGINLLREGLDIPEVSLVAILDADKEGFLRSETSLVQTIGRAARNINGKAILYADRITGSIARALDETQRRRNKQKAHNKKHGITPLGIQKKISDIMMVDGKSTGKGKKRHKTAQHSIEEHSIRSQEDMRKTIIALEKKMFQHAEKLEFEQAIQLRNEIDAIKEQWLMTHAPH